MINAITMCFDTDIYVFSALECDYDDEGGEFLLGYEWEEEYERDEDDEKDDGDEDEEHMNELVMVAEGEREGECEVAFPHVGDDENEGEEESLLDGGEGEEEEEDDGDSLLTPSIDDDDDDEDCDFGEEVRQSSLKVSLLITSSLPFPSLCLSHH